MRKRIEISSEAKKCICKDFNVSHVTLWSALTFKTNSRVAYKLRKVALERGGKELVIQDVDKFDFETTFDSLHETMTQQFGPDCRIEVHIPSGSAGVYINGELKFKEKEITVGRLMNIQAEVHKIALSMK